MPRYELYLAAQRDVEELLGGRQGWYVLPNVTHLAILHLALLILYTKSAAIEADIFSP